MSPTTGRVTLVVNHADTSSETFIGTLARLLRVDGYEVTLHELSGRSAGAGRAIASDSDVRRSSALPAIRSPRFVPSTVERGLADPSAYRSVARRALRRFGRGQRAAKAAVLAAPLVATRPDVVHIGFSPIGVALLDALELLEDTTRVLVSCRGSGELVQPVLQPDVRGPLGRLLERVDAVHAVSDDIAEVVSELAPAQSNVHVIRPAIDTEMFHRVVPRRPMSSPVHFVTVSRLHWIKAVDVQLAALAQLRSRGVDAHLTIVGDGPERDPLRFRSNALGLGGAVEFVGSRSPKDVCSLVQRADVFVLSSLSEGTSNAVLEAMALEVPVISSAVGGMDEVLESGTDALLVAPGDPDELSRAMERLVADPALADSLALAGRQKVQERFGLERQRAELRELYRSVRGSDAGPGSDRRVIDR